jgi:hypothetical protein
VALVMGMLLEAVRRVRDEGARLAYLRLPPPGHQPPGHQPPGHQPPGHR